MTRGGIGFKDRRTAQQLRKLVEQQPPSAYAMPPKPLAGMVWLIESPDPGGIPGLTAGDPDADPPTDDQAGTAQAPVRYLDPEGKIQEQKKPGTTDDLVIDVWNISPFDLPAGVLMLAWQVGGRAIVGAPLEWSGMALTPSGGIAPNGFADCDKLVFDGSGSNLITEGTVNVFNGFTSPIEGNTRITYQLTDGRYVVNGEDCPPQQPQAQPSALLEALK